MSYTTLASVSAPHLASPPKISFCANSWPCIRSATSNPNGDPGHATHADLACPMLQLATGPGDCLTSHVDPLASPGNPAVLGLEIPAWPPTNTAGAAGTHPPHGPRQPHVGRGADRQRTAPQDGPPGVPTHGAQIPAALP